MLAALLAVRPAAAQETTDAGDLWHRVRHHDEATDEARSSDLSKPVFVTAPAVGDKPSTGINGGIASNVAFVAGDHASTHLSSISGSVKVSEKAQTLSAIRLAVFLPDDRWFLQGDNRLNWTSLDTYGLGGETTSDDLSNLKYDQSRINETVFHSVARGLFVGAGIDINKHTNVRPGATSPEPIDQAAYTQYTQEHGFRLSGQTSSGTTASVMYDTRDNSINARSGWYANATYRTFFTGFLGGDSTWQEAYLDVRTYRRLTRDGRRLLAFWLLGDLVTGGVAPYFDLPTTAGDPYGRSARGYGEGRYRGDHLLYGEVEYRETLTRNGLLGYVAFFNTTTLASETTGEQLFESFAPGAGGGLRVLLSKKSRTNLCVDYGWGKQGSHALYLAIQEAF